MNPRLQHRIGDLADRLHQLPHGQKSQEVQAFARRHDLSAATVWRHLRTWRPRSRQRRSDAHQGALRRDEARLIAAYLLASARRNGKRLASIALAVDVLRANGRIAAGRIDATTGEFLPLSVSAIGRALRGYGLHPDQLGRPSPKMALASRHPNHVWQSDASLCVLYYLRDQAGLRVMEADRFYKNKPRQLARIAHERVWRYVFVDHASGALYVEYVLGAESGANHLHCLIEAMQYRGEDDSFHGVPSILMVDPGSANTSHAVRHLCHALGIALQVTKPGQPWAKGAVEKSHDLVERLFEHGLKFVAVEDLDQLNTLAHRWMRRFNASAVHTRTGQTRYALWQTITPTQLRLAPPREVCRALALEAPQTRVVSPQLTVQWRGETFDVADVPGVMVGETLTLTRHPWGDDHTAQVTITDAQGQPGHVVIHAIRTDAYGFPEGAPVIGERYARHADTRADTERKRTARLTMQAATDAEAALKRKAGHRPFGGELDPYHALHHTPPTRYIRPVGTPSNVTLQAHLHRPLNVVEAAQQLRQRLGDDVWTSAHFAVLQAHYPDGVPADHLDALATTLASLPHEGTP